MATTDTTDTTDALQRRADDIYAADKAEDRNNETPGMQREWPPRWAGYEARANDSIEAIVNAAVYVMDAPDDEVDESEINLDDADDLLTGLSDAYNALCPPRAGQLADRALAVWQGRMTLAQAVADDTIPPVEHDARTPSVPAHRLVTIDPTGDGSDEPPPRFGDVS